MKKIAIVMIVSAGFLSANVFVDRSTGLMWQDDESVKTTEKSWADAIAYCNDFVLGDYSDWRLPKRVELLSIADKTKYDPAIINGFQYVTSGFYWSSSPGASGTSGAWSVNFKDGGDYWDGKSGTDLVRCVRDSQ